MPRFRFRLQAVLELKQQQEQALAVQLAARAAALERARDRLQQLIAQRDGVLDVLAAAGRALPIDEAGQGFAYIDAAAKRIAAQAALVQQAENDLATVRAALVRCRQEIDMLEELRARQRAAWLRAELQREEKIAGEIATSRFLQQHTPNRF
jgi:flagellar FliJ protein